MDTNNNNTNTLLDPIPEVNPPQREKKEKPKKPKATAPANNNKKIEEMAIDVEMAQEQPQEQKEEVIMDTNINVNTPPKIKLTIQVETPNTNNNRTPKQKKRKIVAEDDADEDFTPSKKNSAKKKRGTYNSDDDDDYAPSKKSAKKNESNKKRGRKDDAETGGEDWSTNKRQKVTNGSPKKVHGPKYFFARFDKDARIPRDNGKLIVDNVKSWVTAVENLPEKDMKSALIEDKVEAKDENTSNQTAVPLAAPTSPEAKSPKLKKSPSQTKIEKQSHNVDVEKFYECLRPTDWTHQTPEKVSFTRRKCHAVLT
jgi:hypothetical protein